MKAYLHITAEDPSAVARRLREEKNVISSDRVRDLRSSSLEGAPNVIILVETEDIRALLKFITNRVHSLAGIDSLRTFFVEEEEE